MTEWKWQEALLLIFSVNKSNQKALYFRSIVLFGCQNVALTAPLYFFSMKAFDSLPVRAFINF